MAREHPQVVVVGAGITGLACALALRERGVSVLVVDAAQRAGGKVETTNQDGYQFECGPNTVMLNEPLRWLIRCAGLEEEVVSASSQAKKRYVLVGDQLRTVPMGPVAALRSPLVGMRGMLDVALEVARRRPQGTPRDESAAAFVRRRFGNRIAENLVGPFLRGVYAGDAERLEARSVLRRLVEAEERHGSVIRGLLASRKKREKRESITLRGGLESLPQRLGATLGADLRLGTAVTELQERGDACAVRLTGGETVACSRVVLACEPKAAAGLLSHVPDAAFARRDLESIEHAGLAVVGLAYRREQVSHPLDGFGYLTGPGAYSGAVLGCMFRSSIFPHTAPTGSRLLIAFVQRVYEGRELGEHELVRQAQVELTTRLGARSSPLKVFLRLWDEAIAQPTRGHDAKRERIAAWSSRGRISIVSSAVHGVALGQCAETGVNEADRIATLIGDIASSYSPQTAAPGCGTRAEAHA
jgi:oxygen-dependent protoporphyrinogen oxidase